MDELFIIQQERRIIFKEDNFLTFFVILDGVRLSIRHVYGLCSSQLLIEK